MNCLDDKVFFGLLLVVNKCLTFYLLSFMLVTELKWMLSGHVELKFSKIKEHVLCNKLWFMYFINIYHLSSPLRQTLRWIGNINIHHLALPLLQNSIELNF